MGYPCCCPQGVECQWCSGQTPSQVQLTLPLLQIRHFSNLDVVWSQAAGDYVLTNISTLEKGVDYPLTYNGLYSRIGAEEGVFEDACTWASSAQVLCANGTTSLRIFVALVPNTFITALFAYLGFAHETFPIGAMEWGDIVVPYVIQFPGAGAVKDCAAMDLTGAGNWQTPFADIGPSCVEWPYSAASLRLRLASGAVRIQSL